MKKLLALVLVTMMVLSLSACKKEISEPEVSDVGTPEMLGAPVDAASPAVSDDLKALFAKAMGNMTGSSIVPVALVSTQVVAGTNYVALCEVTPVVPNAMTQYALVRLYADLEGNAEILEIINSEAVVKENELAGGWTKPETPEVTEKAAAALEKSLENMTGASMKPVALLATQVVAGVNYEMLCNVTPVVPNAESHYSIVTVFEGLDGTAQIMNTVDFINE